MQKKILASLLMVPMAYSAFANIGVNVPVDKDSWSADGLVGENLTFKPEEGTVESKAIGTGFIAQTLKDLPQGTYTLTFASATNVKVTVNGKPLSKENTFVLTEKSDVTLQIGADDPAQIFKFTGLTLEIVCDFEAIQEALTTQLLDKLYGDQKIAEVIKAAVDAKFENAVELNNETTSLKKKVGVGGTDAQLAGTIRGEIREIRKGAAEGTTQAEALAIYDKYQLWLGADGCTVGVEIKNLTTQVEEHNAAVKTLNDRWNTKVANEATKAQLLAEVADLQKQLDAVKADAEAAAQKPAYDKFGVYITDQTADDIAAIQTAIDAYKAAIEAAYAEEKLPEKIEFASQTAAIQKSIDDLKVKFQAAEADVQAYIAWLNATRELLADYKTGSTTIIDLQGIPNEEGKYLKNFESLKTETLAAIEDIYNNAVNNFKIKEVRFDEEGNIVSGNIGEAAENLDADLKTIADATADLDTTVVALVAHVDDQNSQMKTALDALATPEGELNALKLPKSYKAGDAGDQLKTAQEELEAEIAALKAKLDAAYAEGGKDLTKGLPVENFEDDLNTLNGNVAAFVTIAKPICDLQGNLVAAYEKLIKDYGKDSKNGKAIYGDKLVEKFNTVIANIEEAIGALPVYTTDAEGNKVPVEVTMDDSYNVTALGGVELKPIQDAIDALLVNAAELDAAWAAADAAVKQYGEYKAALDKLFQDKLIIPDDFLAKLVEKYQNSEAYKKLAADYAAFLESYATAQEKPAQDCFNAMTALVKGYNADTLKLAFDTVARNFDEEGTNENERYVYDDLFTKGLLVAADLEGDDYVGKDDIKADVAAIQAELDAIGDELIDLREVEPEDYKHADWDTIDKKLDAIKAKIAAEEEKIALYKEYQAIYDQFVLDLSKLQEAIDADTLFNTGDAANDVKGQTTSPATEFWTGEIAKLQTAKDNLKKEIDDALAAYKDAKKNIKALAGDKDKAAAYDETQKDTLWGKYYKQLKDAQDLLPNMQNNEIANTTLLNISNNVRTAINTEIDNLKNKQAAATASGATDIADKIQTWIEELNDLLIDSTDPEDLASVDIEEKSAFAVGQADDKFEALKAKYEKVSTTFKGLQAQYAKDYQDALVSWNNDFLGEKWQAAWNDLYQTYRDAITTYDQYLYGLKNPGYKAYIAETLEDNRDIYKYIDKINALATAAQEYVEAQNKAGVLISQDAFDAIATDIKAQYKTEITTEVETMQTEVAEKAKEYFSQLHAEVSAYIAGEEAKLEAAGNVKDVIEETFKEAYGLRYKAETAYTTWEKSVKLGLEMDFIATDLDNALAPIDIKGAVEDQWAKYDIPAAQKALEPYADMETFLKGEDYVYADQAVKDAQSALIEEAKATVAELATKVADLEGENKLSVLQDALAAALKKAETAAGKIKDSSSKNLKEKKAYEDWTTIVATLTDDLNDLKTFINSLAAGYQPEVQAALKNVETLLYSGLQAAVENNKGNLVASDNYLSARRANVEAAIKNAYGQAAYNESALLTEWTGKLKAAYNDAKVNSGIENFDTVLENETIKKYIDGIEIPSANPTWFNPEDYLETAVALEENIATYYIYLEGLWDKDLNGEGNPNPNKNIFKDTQELVNAAADECSAALNDAYPVLEGATDLKTIEPAKYAAYEEEYQALYAEYEAILGAAAAEANRLILNPDKFINEFKALQAKITKKTEELTAAAADATKVAQDRAASDARYTELLGVYDDLAAEFQALKDKVEEYKIDSTPVNNNIEAIEAGLKAAKEKLEEAKAAWTLTADSALENEDAIRSNIEYTALLAAKAYADKGVAEAWAANADLNEALQKNVVPEIAKALLAEQTTIKVELEDIENAIKALKLDDLETTAAQFEALHDQATELKARLEAMLEEAQESVYVLGDVTLDPDGVIDVADVQLLITWVGQGKTYADLYAMSPVIAAAANVAQEPGEDPAINIADVTKEIDLMMNFEYGTPTARSFVQRRAAAQGSINATLIGSENGNYRYMIALNSTQAFVAGQLDIVVPEGSEIVGAQIVGMSHQLYQFNNDGYTRMIIASLANEEINGDQLLIVEVNGNGAPAIDAAVFTDSKANAYTLSNGTTSGIEGIEAENGMVQRIYNAAGQAMRKIQRGINIIRHNDGTVTKELHK